MEYKKTIILLFSLASFSCSKPTIFVLEDNNENIKYSLSDSVKEAFKNDIVNKTPLVAIDGIIWKYNQKADTVKLPLKKKDITAMQILNKNSSSVIYGAEAINGAIIINTVNLK